MRTINREEIVTNSGHVVVLKGGNSAEREISLLSGDAVFQGLQRLGVSSSVIDVDGNIMASLAETSPDLVFIMLHGAGGEDGVIQGFLETMNLAYSGSNVLSSALAMDKIKSKLIWQRLGLNTAEFLKLTRSSDWQSILDQLGTVVVKPVSGGSSLGIAIVSDADSLQKQYEIARKYDPDVMAEQYIEGKEFSITVLDEQLLPAIQLETTRQFFDFDAKYVDTGTNIICPPDLSQNKLRELDELALKAYQSLDCEGLVRVDLMQDQDENFFLLEVNTVPGMTSHSFVPMAAKRAGMDFDELLLRILEGELSKRIRRAAGNRERNQNERQAGAVDGADTVSELGKT
ncbi:MAG: D-alanine--D-alanine ligase [Proteobacteria bacterium]|nr:D-alanine--D-alanine ligase [Pseudomonadota bacterium]